MFKVPTRSMETTVYMYILNFVELHVKLYSAKILRLRATCAYKYLFVSIKIFQLHDLYTFNHEYNKNT